VNHFASVKFINVIVDICCAYSEEIFIERAIQFYRVKLICGIIFFYILMCISIERSVLVNQSQGGK